MKILRLIILCIVIYFCNIVYSVQAENYRVSVNSYSTGLDDIDEEYYIVYDKDTSAYSFHFVADVRKNIVLSIVMCPSAKVYEEDYCINKYIVPQEEKLMEEMAACIRMFKSKHKQCYIRYINLMLPDFETTAINTTKNFIQKNDENIYESIERAIDRTNFRAQMNNLLKGFDLKILDIKCFGCVLMVNKSYIVKQKRIQETSNIPSKIIDVEVSLSLTETLES